MSEEEFDTSIALKSKWFEKIKNEDKTVHIDKKDYNVEEGGIVRFMKGYNPDNGSVLRKVKFKYSESPLLVDFSTLYDACVDETWLDEYLDSYTDKVYIYYLEDKGFREQLEEVKNE